MYKPTLTAESPVDDGKDHAQPSDVIHHPNDADFCRRRVKSQLQVMRHGRVDAVYTECQRDDADTDGCQHKIRAATALQKIWSEPEIEGRVTEDPTPKPGYLLAPSIQEVFVSFQYRDVEFTVTGHDRFEIFGQWATAEIARCISRNRRSGFATRFFRLQPRLVVVLPTSWLADWFELHVAWDILSFVRREPRSHG